MKTTAFKLAAALLLIGGSVTAASAQVRSGQVYGVPGVDYGYPPYPHTPQISHSVTPPSAPEQVYQNGKMIGQDPDANVRMMLRKDFPFQ